MSENNPLLSTAPKAHIIDTDNINWRRVLIEREASDADLRETQLLFGKVAAYIVNNGMCLCLHCLSQYADGQSESSAALTTIVHRITGIPSLMRAHRDT